MDLLTSGTDRPPRRLWAAALRWRPPRGVVGALLVAVLLVAGTGVASIAPLRARVERAAVTARVVASTVAVRDGRTEGVLRVAVSNAGRRPVTLTGLHLEMPGVVQGAGTQTRRVVEPGRDVDVFVDFRVPACNALRAPGTLLVNVTPQARPARTLRLPLDDAVTAGCRPASSPYVVALAVAEVSGHARPARRTASGELLITLVNHGGPVRLVSVTAEVPGVLFVSQPEPGGDRVTDPGERVSVPLPFVVPFCADPERVGRLVLTVRDARGELRMVAFPAEAGAGADLSVVFEACGGQPAG